MNSDFDLVLEVVLSAAENSKSEYTQAMTFNIDGILITGNVISEAQYMDELYGGALREAFTKLWDEAEKRNPSSEAEAEADEEQQSSDFIHLKNARFYLSPQSPLLPQSEGLLWRGRISSIAGYVFGELMLDGNK